MSQPTDPRKRAIALMEWLLSENSDNCGFHVRREGKRVFFDVYNKINREFSTVNKNAKQEAL